VIAEFSEPNQSGEPTRCPGAVDPPTCLLGVSPRGGFGFFEPLKSKRGHVTLCVQGYRRPCLKSRNSNDGSS
jgi:hypothetical protein